MHGETPCDYLSVFSYEINESERFSIALQKLLESSNNSGIKGPDIL